MDLSIINDIAVPVIEVLQKVVGVLVGFNKEWADLILLVAAGLIAWFSADKIQGNKTIVMVVVGTLIFLLLKVISKQFI